MTTYRESGVDIDKGDVCSRLAYEAAMGTFPGRKNMTGTAVVLEEGFAGLIDMGDFYLVQNDDGTGSKSEVAWHMRKFDKLGFDLLAMVLDDAVCVGAEMITMSNTIDIETVDEAVIGPMMRGLQEACLKASVIIPGGEIAELKQLVRHVVWNATGVGIVRKDRVINGSTVVTGDSVVALRSDGLRSNGYTLARHIVEHTHSNDPYHQQFEGSDWGDLLLRPSILYAPHLYDIIGRFDTPKEHAIHGIVHITGGGVANNLRRVLKRNHLGATLDNLLKPEAFMLELQKLGNVTDKEAYTTWNMGQGMLVITSDPASLTENLPDFLTPQIVGHVTDQSENIAIVSEGYFDKGNIINFTY
jgi:phosphoribosylformylglycinamidine cyclo-ligase